MSTSAVSYAHPTQAGPFPINLDTLPFPLEARGMSAKPSVLSQSQSLAEAAGNGALTFYDQLAGLAAEIAREVVQSVMQFLLPLLFSGDKTGAPLDAGMKYQFMAGNQGGPGLMQTAAATAKPKEQGLLDKLISWFKVAGDFGHDISNGLKDGRDMLNPIVNGISWALDKGKDALGGIGSSVGGVFQKGIDWVSSLF